MRLPKIRKMTKLKQFGKDCADFIIFCILVFCFFAAMSFILNKRMIYRIYLPGGKWNDEVFYYKQIESVIHYGFPRGFFGYNESHADLLTFGSWSPFLLLPYVIGGKLIGWNYFTPVLLNLFMFACALYMFLKVTGCTIKKQLCIYAVFMASGGIFRYVLSGMTEPVIFSVVLIAISLVCRKVNGSEEIKSRFEIWVILGICFFSTLMRPYLLVLFLYPICFSAKQKRKGEIIGAVLLSVIGILIYFWISNHICAPYYTPIIDLSFLDVMKEDGLFAGLGVIFTRCYNGGISIKNFLAGMFAERKTEYGKSYLFFFLELIFLVVLFLKDLKRKGWKDSLQIIRAVTIGIFISIFGAILIFYDVRMGGRHLFVCVILGTIVLFFDAGRKYSIAVAAVMCICGLIFRLDKAEIPYRSTDTISWIKESEEILQKYVKLNPDTGDYWDNTVAYELGVSYNVLYGMPSGIGIQLDFTSYLLEMKEPVKSKYLIVVPGGELSKRLSELNATLLGRTGSFELFLNPEVPLYKAE